MWCMILKLISWILNDNHNEVLVRCDHDFMLFRANPKECQVVRRIQVPHYASCFVSQLTHQTGILDSRRVV